MIYYTKKDSQKFIFIENQPASHNAFYWCSVFSYPLNLAQSLFVCTLEKTRYIPTYKNTLFFLFSNLCG